MNSRRLIADPRGSQGIVAAQTCTGKDPANVRFGPEADIALATTLDLGSKSLGNKDTRADIRAA
jgi:hypothetical protein